MAQTPTSETPEGFEAVRDIFERQLTTSLSNQAADFAASTATSRSKNTTWIAGGAGTLLASIVTMGGWGMEQIQEAGENATEHTAEIAKLHQAVENMTIEVRMLRKQGETVGIRVVAQEVHSAEGFAWLAAIATEPNARARRKLLKNIPPSIRAASRRAAKLREAQLLDRFFREDTLPLDLMGSTAPRVGL